VCNLVILPHLSVYKNIKFNSIYIKRSNYKKNNLKVQSNKSNNHLITFKFKYMFKVLFITNTKQNQKDITQ